MIRLLYAPTSPFVRKVMVCAHLTGQADAIQLLDSAAHPVKRDPRIAEHNPLAQVPTLILEDGEALYDSRVICEYLAHRAGDRRIFPASGPDRWTALRRQSLGDGVLDAALLARYERSARPPEFQWPVWRDALLAKVEAGLVEIDAIAADLSVDEPCIGAITIGCALGYLDFRLPELEWRARHGAAARWNEDFQQLPAMRATRPHDACPPP